MLSRVTYDVLVHVDRWQYGLAVASIARDDRSTLSGDDPFPRACMHRDRNARSIGMGIWNLN